MRLHRFLAKDRVIDIKSKTFEDAIVELLEVCRLPRTIGSPEEILHLIIESEKTIPTYLGDGIAMPHVKLAIPRPYIFAVGRCPYGLSDSNSSDHKQIKVLFLLLSANGGDLYLNVLSSLARILQDPSVANELQNQPSIRAFRSKINEIFVGDKASENPSETKFNNLILDKAKQIAYAAKCSAVMIFDDVITGDSYDCADKFGNLKTLFVTQKANALSGQSNFLNNIIFVQSFSTHRLAQLRSAIIIGLTRGLIQGNEKICCISGITKSNMFDTISVIDIAKEFSSSVSATNGKMFLQDGIRPEVLERLLAIVGDISVEGREGKPVGCLFVLGDIEKIKPFTKQLVLNPFFGYKEEERNILNPFMAETVKEFSTIDGAFIVRGDGVIESAGTLIQAPNNHNIQMPSGLGTRHAAAAIISLVSESIAITVSESTNQITLFRDGKMTALSEQSLSASTL
ncbi:MAG: diadenylate cyclase [Puniceicoccales bacterium]|jgi:DNA integrity scanning protein DisA with diadenylate cyclase activity/mannitol/fructose-specific phosphotransferase system IIA component (Ntr-type)|nr:diadenylate cyclase [Puniceicoccales bacterium]